MLDVFLHGRRVGTLGQESGSDVISFALEEDYFNDRERAVLGQQFEDRRRVQTFRGPSPRDYPEHLPAFFANLLPEGALREMIEAQRSGRADLDMLAHVGEDLPGAVLVRRSDAPATGVIARGRAFSEPLSAPAETETGELRFSLAGIQLKFSAVRSQDLRFTLPFRGRGGRWILKFGSTSFPSLPENEFAVMQWAARSGLDVPHHELISASSIGGLDPRFLDLGEHVFAIERYDRLHDGTRVHQEDFAQVRGARPDRKYRNAGYDGIARFVGDLCGADDLREVLRRLVFMLLCGNYDAHLKNWSLIYPDQRTARLAPAYDFVFVAGYPVKPELALPLDREKVPGRITWDHFRRLEGFLRENNHEIPVEAEARAFARHVLEVWDGYRNEVDVKLRASIDRYLARLPIASR